MCVCRCLHFFAKQLIDQLNQLAIHDSLTGLYQRHFLIDSIPNILKRKKRAEKRLLAIVFMYIDRFKRVNDRYGHAVGDNLLSRVARTVPDDSRPSDPSIRNGGGEFVVVGLFASEAAILRYAERLGSITSTLVFNESDEAFSITQSVGISLYQDGGEAFEEALQRADAFLYQAKEADRPFTPICIFRPENDKYPRSSVGIAPELG
ncbi:MAG: GGDEF domain-containing protein [Candidatus Thiodiazotropha sp.]